MAFTCFQGCAAAAATLRGGPKAASAQRSGSSDFLAGRCDGVLRLKQQRPVLRATALRIAIRPRALVHHAAPSGSPSGPDSPSFRLDELVSGRARQAPTQARHRGSDFLEVRRTGRRVATMSTRLSSSSSPSSSFLRDARNPLLGLLDDLGDRVSGRRGKCGGSDSAGASKRGVSGIMESSNETRSGSKGDGGDESATASMSAGAVAFSDMFEAPGGRVARSESVRTARVASKKRGGSMPVSNSSRKDALLLGLLSGPSSRTDRGAARAAAVASASAATAPLLGILSGPAKRTGRHRHSNAVAVATAA